VTNKQDECRTEAPRFLPVKSAATRLAQRGTKAGVGLRSDPAISGLYASATPSVFHQRHIGRLIVIEIRSAAPTDAHSLWDAERQTAMTPGLLVASPGEILVEALEAKIESLGSRGRYIVAEIDRAPVGHAFLEPLGALAATSHVFQLTIVVHPGHLGRGIGTTLLGDLLGWAQRDSRVKKVELRVRSTNQRAIALYRKFGFVEEGCFRSRVALQDGTFVDDLAMAWFP
jgi:RimJ/RimL family protein N-acetyltransferase